ncbi:hypothetical protein ACFS3C_19210 [Azotobacter vinelandii]
MNGINTSGAGVWIATGPAGGISRSTNGGVTWTAVTSGVTATLGQPSYGGGKWVIPYATNKVLISADDGASWTDTTVQGSFSFSATGKTAYLNGAFVYSDLSTKLYRSTDGVNWSDVGDTARGGRDIYQIARGRPGAARHPGRRQSAPATAATAG